MSNYSALHSVGESLMTYLRNAYPEPLRTDHPCAFKPISSGELAKPDPLETSVTLFLYRLTMNEHLRNSARRDELGREQFPLPLDLHYLLTVWADTPFAEMSIFGWTLQQLHQRPLLDLSSLSPEAGWNTWDYVQLIPAELSTEDLMRIWDALEPPYRLSASFIGRVVRIDGDVAGDARRVMATRVAVGAGATA